MKYTVNYTLTDYTNGSVSRTFHELEARSKQEALEAFKFWFGIMAGYDATATDIQVERQ